MISARDIEEILLARQDIRQRDVLLRFFKTAPGQYGEGDCFLGLKVPQVREVVKAVRGTVPLEEIEILLYSPWHEVRLCALLLIVEEMKRALPRAGKDSLVRAQRRATLADFYLEHLSQANNWDLVDLSCPHILGVWLLYPQADGTYPSRLVLDRLAESSNLWEQRAAIVTTLAFIRAGQTDDTLRLVPRLLSHPHDLIHKATGWMLREVGKRDIQALRGFLDVHVREMARVTLRYAIEKMDETERRYWMAR